VAKPADSEKNEGILKRARKQREEIKPMRTVWAEVVSQARDEKARIEASPPPPPAPVAEEPEPEEIAKEVTPEEQRELNEKRMRAARYLNGRKRTWGIDKHIYHKIPRPLDRRADRHVDRKLTLKIVHVIRRPVDRRIRRGRGLIEGVNPFRRMANWRH